MSRAIAYRPIAREMYDAAVDHLFRQEWPAAALHDMRVLDYLQLCEARMWAATARRPARRPSGRDVAERWHMGRTAAQSWLRDHMADIEAAAQGRKLEMPPARPAPTMDTVRRRQRADTRAEERAAARRSDADDAPAARRSRAAPAPAGEPEVSADDRSRADDAPAERRSRAAPAPAPRASRSIPDPRSPIEPSPNPRPGGGGSPEEQDPLDGCAWEVALESVESYLEAGEELADAVAQVAASCRAGARDACAVLRARALVEGGVGGKLRRERLQASLLRAAVRLQATNPDHLFRVTPPPRGEPESWELTDEEREAILQGVMPGGADPLDVLEGEGQAPGGPSPLVRSHTGGARKAQRAPTAATGRRASWG